MVILLFFRRELKDHKRNKHKVGGLYDDMHELRVYREIGKNHEREHVNGAFPLDFIFDPGIALFFLAVGDKIRRLSKM